MAYTPPIIPPLNPVTTGPASVGQNQNPPLPQLPQGTVLQGTISGKDAAGNYIIKTDALRLVLNTQYPLKQEMQVAVRLDQTLASHLGKATPQQVQIVSVDGKPAQPLSPQPPPNAPPEQVAALSKELAKPIGMLLDVMNRPGAALANKTPAEGTLPQAPTRGVASEVNVSEGMRVAAVLLRPATSQAAATLLGQLGAQLATPLASPANALRPGLQLQVQILQMPAASAAAPVSPTAQPSLPPVAGQPPTAPVPTATNPDAALVSGAQMRSGYASYARQAPAMMSGTPPQAAPSPMGVNKTAASQPPAPPVTSSQSTSPATPVSVPQNLTPQVVGQLLARAEAQPLPQGQMTAVVMGKEQGGALIVQTRLGMFSLPQVQADAATPGTVLNWQVRGVQVPQAMEQMPVGGAANLLATAAGFTSEWSALDELASALQSLQSGVAAQALQRAIPHAGSQMTAGMLFFMSVLRNGSVQEWLGRDMVSQLERMGKGDLVQRLGGDLAAVRSLFVDQPPGNWQAMFFPVMVDKQLEHAQMFLKQEQDDEKKKGGGGTRFVVELELSNLGPMQIDGFIKKRDTGTQFDLVMRTISELPDDLKTDIYGIFENAQKVAGYNGSLAFKLVSEFPVHPLEEMQREGGGDSGSIMA